MYLYVLVQIVIIAHDISNSNHGTLGGDRGPLDQDVQIQCLPERAPLSYLLTCIHRQQAHHSVLAE